MAFNHFVDLRLLNKVAMAVSALELEFHQQFDDTMESNRPPSLSRKRFPFYGLESFSQCTVTRGKKKREFFSFFLHGQI